MNSKQNTPSDAWNLLSSMITSERRDKMSQVVENRTGHIRLIVQDIHNPHNVSACLRSADAFGVQFIDVVTLKKSYKASSVTKGSRHWLTIQNHQSVEECVASLKKAGYLIAAGMPPHSGSVSLSELPISKPVAVLFGNEHEGVHESWKPHINIHFSIPMFGMVESLNISVSAAVTLQRLTERARASESEKYQLTVSQKEALLNEWIFRQFKRNEKILSRLREKKLTSS